MRRKWSSVVMCGIVGLTLWQAQALAQAPPAPTPAAEATAVPAKPTPHQDPALRLALATTRIRALTAAIEFNALRLLLANLENDQAVLDALSQVLGFLTDEKNTTGGKKQAASVPPTGSVAPQAASTPAPGKTP